MKLRINNISVELSFTLICIAAVCVILNIFSSLIWCILAVVIHESGHLFAMLKCGYFPERIKISAFEIKIIDRKRYLRTDKQNIFIIFSGPAVNFICFIPFFLIYLLGNDYVLPFAASNISVGLFNILPVMSLDGGQLAYIFLRRKIGSVRAERTVDTITFITVFPLAILGFMLLLSSRYNFSLLFVCVYLILSLITRGSRFL